jgi:hypothetical protein
MMMPVFTVDFEGAIGPALARAVGLYGRLLLDAASTTLLVNSGAWVSILCQSRIPAQPRCSL